VNRALDLLHRLRRRLWSAIGWRTRGVKVMLFDEAGELILVRHSYGRSDLFLLPGGGIRPFESPAAAAAREMREELDCALADLALVAVHVSTGEGRRDTVHLFRARAAGPVRADGREIAEARAFALDRLPATLSPATARRIEEHRGLRPPSETW
jgi:ADP-ribose pyrophosphatase YjhB (NUDIX family)